MPKKLIFTEKELKGYFTGEVKGTYYAAAQKQAKRLQVHADGVYPEEIIKERRPHEDPEVQAYRASIWKAKTKPTFTKVLNSLSKIRRSTDWQIGYPQEDFPRIPEGEQLEDYCERKFPFFTSVTNWTFSVLLRHYLIDPNAVMVVRPLEIPLDPTELVKPYPVIYSSSHVIDYREENYCVILNPLGTVYNEGSTRYAGNSYYIITTERIMRYDQTDSQRGFNKVEDMPHGLGFLPAYQLKAVVKANIDDSFLYESRLDAMVEELDEAAREYSDLQAARVMNIFPERWEISTSECMNCQGTGVLPAIAEGGTTPPCEKCHGTGYLSASGPYSKMVIKRSLLDTAAGGPLPIPPAGYVQKDVEVVKVQDEGVQKHLYDALAAINMEFLASVPLAESGVAKAVDRDETTNFVHSIAEDIVRIMDWLYLAVASWRYGVQYSLEDIKEMLPRIPVPEHFDLFSTRYAEEDIKNSKENKLNPVIIAAMELAYAGKKFNAEPEVRDRLMLVFELDPFHNISEEDKSTRLQNNSIRKVDYIISSNIQQFIQRAIIEDPAFPGKPYEQQRAVLEAYANTVVDETSAARKVANAIPVEQEYEEEEGAENEEENGGNVENEAQQGEQAA